MVTAGTPATRVIGPVTVTDFVRYQGASGDLNPIHHDAEFAQAAGFPTFFAVGMFNAGVLGTYLADLYGAANIRRFAVQFRAQVWPGDLLTLAVTEASERVGEDGAKILDVEATVVRQTGQIAITGSATFVA